MRERLRVAVIGAGMGGLTTAFTLRQIGAEVTIYEQAPGFARIGAGIQMSPNAVKVLRGLGLEQRMREIAFEPQEMRNRVYDTGELTFELPVGKGSEERYGAPYFLLHRGDLHAALASVVPEEIIQLRRRLVDLEPRADGVRCLFEDGTAAEADLVVAADGVHSRAREILFGSTEPRYTQRVAYRTVYPRELLRGLDIDPNCKWWGPDRHIVIYYISGGREIYFTTSVPETEWSVESWSAKGDLHELREAYATFHPHVRAVLEACPDVNKWAIYERDPMERWSDGRVVLLGDACHPMTPYMAQGAATSMEDAVVLARALDGSSSVEAALQRYEAVRRPRTSRIQLTSRQNTWMRGQTDPGWVYGYDAWQVPLDPQDAEVAAQA